MKLKKGLIFFIAYGFSFMVHTAYAQELGFNAVKDNDKLKNVIKDEAKKIISLKSNFIQEKLMSFLSEKIVSKGIFIYKKPQLLRWEYTEPYKYLIVINNKKLYVKNDKNTTKINIQSNKVFGKINDILMGCVQGQILDNKDFIMTYFENEHLYKILLLPLDLSIKEFIKEIHLFIDKKDMTATRIEMIEPNDDKTIITFSNKKVNESVPENMFSIK